MGCEREIHDQAISILDSVLTRLLKTSIQSKSLNIVNAMRMATLLLEMPYHPRAARPPKVALPRDM
jgi:hypothetical protein